MSDDEDLRSENLDHDVETFEDEAQEVQVDNEGGEATEEADKQTVKPKRVIRNPQPKLNAETLKGKRGLEALPSYFDRVKYKGRGYEEQDLGVILKTYEYWCHRLFPKYPFDECISKIENLGTKRPVMTHIKRIRFDMLFDDQQLLDNDHDSETEEIPNDQFDELVQSANIQPSADINEELLERIRLNKERAERIRREKLQQNMEITSSLQENNELHKPVENSTSLSSETQSTEPQDEFCDDVGEHMEISEMGGSQESIHNDNTVHDAEVLPSALNTPLEDFCPVRSSQIEPVKTQTELCGNIDDDTEISENGISQELTVLQTDDAVNSSSGLQTSTENING